MQQPLSEGRVGFDAEDLQKAFSCEADRFVLQLCRDQRLVYSGRLLQDHLQLRDVLRKVGVWKSSRSSEEEPFLSVCC